MKGTLVAQLPAGTHRVFGSYDFNTYTTPGEYLQKWYVPPEIAGESHSPNAGGSVSAGLLIVEQVSEEYVLQTYKAWRGGLTVRIDQRVGNPATGDWGEWTTVQTI